MATRTSILAHVIEPTQGTLAPETAKYLLSLDFPQADQSRFAVLSTKAQAGSLTEEEQNQLDEFLAVNDLLTIMQAKARASLSNGHHAA